MLYQLSYTPKSIAAKAGTRTVSAIERDSLEPECRAFNRDPLKAQVPQAAARFRFSPSSVFTVEPDTGLEKI
jgi:hypothetical protein